MNRLKILDSGRVVLVKGLNDSLEERFARFGGGIHFFELDRIRGKEILSVWRDPDGSLCVTRGREGELLPLERYPAEYAGTSEVLVLPERIKNELSRAEALAFGEGLDRRYQLVRRGERLVTSGGANEDSKKESA